MKKIALIISLIALFSQILLAESLNNPRKLSAEQIRELLAEVAQHDGDPRLAIADFENVFGKHDRTEKVKVLFGGEVCLAPIHFAFLEHPTLKYLSKMRPPQKPFHRGIRHQDATHVMVCGN